MLIGQPAAEVEGAVVGVGHHQAEVGGLLALGPQVALEPALATLDQGVDEQHVGVVERPVGGQHRAEQGRVGGHRPGLVEVVAERLVEVVEQALGRRR